MKNIPSIFNFKFFPLIFLFILFSCSQKEDKTLKFWHFQSEPQQKQALTELVSEFEKKTGYKVEMTELSWNDGKTKLMAAFNSGTPPDILELGSDWIAQFSSAGVLSALDKDSMSLDRFISFSLAPAIWNSTCYAIPWTVDTRVMFYNKDLLQKASFGGIPQDLDALADACEKINDPENNIYGFGANGSDPHRLYKKIICFIWTMGGDILDREGKPVLNSQENINALELYCRLANSGIMETQRQLDSYFVKGKIAFWISGGWLLETIAHENPGLNFGVAPIPSYRGNKGISFAGGEYLAISSVSKKMKPASELITFLTDGKNSMEFCRKVSSAGFPADKNYYKDVLFMGNPYKSVFAEQLDNARMTPVIPQWLDIEAALENAVVESLLAKKSPVQALNDAQNTSLGFLTK